MAVIPASDLERQCICASCISNLSIVCSGEHLVPIGCKLGQQLRQHIQYYDAYSSSETLRMQEDGASGYKAKSDKKRELERRAQE